MKTMMPIVHQLIHISLNRIRIERVGFWESTTNPLVTKAAFNRIFKSRQLEFSQFELDTISNDPFKAGTPFTINTKYTW